MYMAFLIPTLHHRGFRFLFYRNDSKEYEEYIRTVRCDSDQRKSRIRAIRHGRLERNVKSNRKRGIEDEDVEENGHESGDPSAQKKPGVVWSIDLHRKFVAAVNQLGIEKAVPKRNLDLMNVDGIIRENVASHLQLPYKYLTLLQAGVGVVQKVADAPLVQVSKTSSPFPLCNNRGTGDWSFPRIMEKSRCELSQ
ncbi:hypothetical protein L2E82_02811 [Cichorium intybus]|uniref:Uncharacterized protein n=1 Tax=Cichorium intybus TaxID=13427 RepID=A0ACB9H4V0_CICIN|nr:hypothetical protein L2E82_02811 [Cichorium intybus]